MDMDGLNLTNWAVTFFNAVATKIKKNVIMVSAAR